MKLVIDTCNKDLYVALVHENRVIEEIIEYDLIKKADILSQVIADLLVKAHINSPCDIKEIYVTKGPGSFMGSRTGLLFAKILALNIGAKLFTASSFVFCSIDNKGRAYIDARGSQFYCWSLDNQDKEHFSLVNNGALSALTHNRFRLNPSLFLSRFSQINDITKEAPIYLKDPKIGGD